MAHNSPFDDSIPRDPSRGDSDANESLHESHWHDDAPKKRVNDAPRCGHCGYDRTDLQANDICPECSKVQESPRCTFCGYELSGLQVTQCCPECGKPIWDSNINPPTSGLSIASMVLGIVSLMSCIFYGIPALVLGPLAIVFGEIANRQHKKGTRGGNTKGFALTGRICGWIGFAAGGTVVGLLVWAIFIA